MNWLPIPTHPHYQVSDTGQVRRANNHKPLYSYSRGGRVTIGLSTGGKLTAHSVARLVYAAFKEAIPDGLHVFHRDGNYENNALNNLFLEKRGYK